MIDRFMRVLDWIAFIFFIFVSASVFVTIYDGRDFSELPSFPSLILYIFIKIIIYVVQGKWRWFPWSK